MKRFKNIFRTLVLVVFGLLTATGAYATDDNSQPADSTADAIDSVQISLLTCSPGQKIWSVFGHTAIRVCDPVHQQDLAVNYGMFSFQKSYFVLRFIFGLTDYEMGVEPMDMFLYEYARNGRGITEQRLRLSREEKLAILQAIDVNYQPANRVYRYNYFYDNCTTRARDIIVSHIHSKVDYHANPTVTTSYRDMVHAAVIDHPWYRFGYDLLLGVGSDLKTDYQAQQFLPDSLCAAFARATISAGGHQVPLVDTTTVLLQPMAVEAMEEPTLEKVFSVATPLRIFTAIMVISLAFTIAELNRKRKFWLFDAILLPIVGLAGFVLVAMIFSEHPTVRVNLQLLLLNPLALIFAYPAIRQGIKGKVHWFWITYMVFILLYFISGLCQVSAEGMDCLALALLVRCWSYAPKGLLSNWRKTKEQGNHHS